MPLHALAEYPGPHLHVVARVAETHPSLMAQLPVPGRVYLHKAIVERPVFVVVDGSRVETALRLCDGPKKLWRYLIRCTSLFEAEGANVLGGKDYESDSKEAPAGGTNIADPMFQPSHRQVYYLSRAKLNPKRGD